MQNKVSALLFSVVMMLAASPAGAAVIFSNFGPGDSYDSTNSDPVGSPTPLSTTASASAFTPGASYALDSIELGMIHFSGANELDIALASDSSGRPGTILETIRLTGIVPGLPAPKPPVFAASVLNPLLAAGSQYWVIASAASETFMNWHWNNTGDLGPIGIRIADAPWSTVPLELRGAMRINGTAVAAIPEPTTYALMLAGLGVVAFAARRRKRVAMPRAPASRP